MNEKQKLDQIVDGNFDHLGGYTLRDVELTKIKTNPMNTLYFADAGSMNNKNQHSANSSTYEGNSFQQLVASIKMAGGIHNPILVTRDYRIISGHRRYLAYCQLGYTTIPALVLKKEILPAVEKFILIDANIQGRVYRHPEKLDMLRKARLECYFEIMPGLKARLVSKDSKVTAKEVSEKTGIALGKVKYDLTELKRKATKEVNKIIYSEKGVDSDCVSSVLNNLSRVMAKYSIANSGTRKILDRHIAKFVKDVGKL